MFVGCGDLYGGSTNANRKYLAPHAEVSANSGAWQSRGSHFDVGSGPENDFREHYNSDHDFPSSCHPAP